MRTPTIASQSYHPNQAPHDVKELQRYLDAELNRIAEAIRLVSEGHIDASHVAPDKPREGDIRYADGTNWDPGSGEGIYFYSSASAWVKL